MPRDIDERKKRKALRQLRKAAELAEAGLGPPLSDWEKTFLEEVEERIETYGSAFGDASKGDLEDPLSALQKVKLKEIDKKARGKGMKRSGFKSKRPAPPAPVENEAPAPEADTPEPPAPPRPSGRPAFRVIDGGKTD